MISYLITRCKRYINRITKSDDSVQISLDSAEDILTEIDKLIKDDEEYYTSFLEPHRDELQEAIDEVKGREEKENQKTVIDMYK